MQELSGILSIALIERLQTMPQIKYVYLVCYENDSQIIELLRANLQWVCQKSTLKIEYKVREENYILSQMLEYNGKLGAKPDPLKFDMVIGNPPYMKIAKDAPRLKLCLIFVMERQICIFYLLLWECMICVQMAN